MGFIIKVSLYRNTKNNGWTNEVLRVHIGLECPGKAYLKVEDEVIEWEDGKLFVFDDTKLHEAHNSASKERVVFLLDFYRE